MQNQKHENFLPKILKKRWFFLYYYKGHLQRHPVINKLVSQASQVVIFFLRCLTHRISQAKTKNSPSVPPFGRLRLLRESVAGERTAGGKRQNKRCSLGHRTMRQGSKLSLFAANLRHGRKVRPCSRPLGAQGGVFGYSGGKREQEKRPPLVVSFLVGSPCWTRTSDTLINSQVLYRLS